MTTHVVYAPDGRIHAWLYGGDFEFDRTHNTPEGMALLAVDDPTIRDGTGAYYVAHQQVVARPASPVQLEGTTLSQLPVPAELHIDGVAYALEAPTVTLEFPLPGTYTLRVVAFPYLDWTGEVTRA